MIAAIKKTIMQMWLRAPTRIKLDYIKQLAHRAVQPRFMGLEMTLILSIMPRNQKESPTALTFHLCQIRPILHLLTPHGMIRTLTVVPKPITSTSHLVKTRLPMVFRQQHKVFLISRRHSPATRRVASSPQHSTLKAGEAQISAPNHPGLRMLERDLKTLVMGI